jgi:hypothetical protein
MKPTSCTTRKIKAYEAETRMAQPEPRPLGRLISCLVLIGGLIMYMGVQGGLVNIPLWNRSMPPELDDSLTYILKTKQMQESLFQVAPALEDLRRQLYAPSDNPEVARQRTLAGSRIFPLYHPLFSIILISLNKLGLELITAFKLVWSLGPLIFGLAFAYFLTRLFGAGAAGLALALLAFKVFPDTGLHYVVPSNLTMALALIIWGRLVSCQGKAPWTLALGSLALVTMHPIGAIYAVMSVALAFLLAEGKVRLTTYLPMLFVVLLVALFLIIPAVTRLPSIPNLLVMPGGNFSPLAMCRGAVISGLEVILVIVRFGGGLFGSPPIFCAAVVLGWVTLSSNVRRPVLTILSLNLLFLFGALFYLSTHPADLFLRLWIPLVVILFGLVGQSLAFAAQSSWKCWQNLKPETGQTNQGGWQLLWPLVLIAFLTGYAIEMSVKGGEIIATTAEYMQTSQPLEFSAKQPQLLLTRAQPQDKVFYNSIIIMPYYFIHGASRLGAVYYHPAFRGTPEESAWLSLPALRFAVTYNPLIYHPSFAGVDENNWWIEHPDAYFSPLSKTRKYGPLAKDGQLAAADFSWLELEPKSVDFPKLLKIKIKNPGGASNFEVIPLASSRTLLHPYKITAPVPARWSGWVSLNLDTPPGVKRLRILLPAGAPRYQIQGIIFGEDRLLWPWSQKASLTLLPREQLPEITVSFDPADILPAPLNTRAVRVLDDQGSSVLFQLNP